jgi:hypothetical protein
MVHYKLWITLLKLGIFIDFLLWVSYIIVCEFVTSVWIVHWIVKIYHDFCGFVIVSFVILSWNLAGFLLNDYETCVIYLPPWSTHTDTRTTGTHRHVNIDVWVGVTPERQAHRVIIIWKYDIIHCNQMWEVSHIGICLIREVSVLHRFTLIFILIVVDTWYEGMDIDGMVSCLFLRFCVNKNPLCYLFAKNLESLKLIWVTMHLSNWGIVCSCEDYHVSIINLKFIICLDFTYVLLVWNN